VTLSSGGDIEIQKNGRYANFGTLTASGNGNFQIDDGGQSYVGGNISMTGGADLVNSNSTNPWGFYYNGTNSASGGGSISSNSGTASVMNSTNPVFAAWVNGVFNTLPVELAYFRISAVNDNSIEISWVTTLEKNADEFFLEKSIDGNTFYNVYSVHAKNVPDIQNKYAFTDYEPIQGRSYYRLKTADFDGTTSYSSVVSVLYKAESDVSVYPNPVKEKSINFHLNFTPLKEDFIRIIDSYGREVHRTSANSHTMTIPVGNLSAGLYHLHFVSGGFNKIIKIVLE